MNSKRERFCLEYVANGGNAKQAYIDSGYSERGARQSAYRLLTNADVRRKVRECHREIHEMLMVEKGEILRELTELAMFDPRGLFGDDGRLLSITEMDSGTAKSVQEIEVVLVDKHCSRVKVKFGRDKMNALDKLMRYFNAYEDQSAAKTKEIKICRLYPD